MPRPRFQRAAPELRDAILDAAAQELAEHGYELASINRILVAAGLSKGAFYYYFDDKLDLALAVLEREFSELIAEMGELPSPGTVDEFWAEMDRFQARGLAQMRQSPVRVNLVSRLGLAFAKKSEWLDRLGPALQDWRRRFGALWARGQQIGAVRTDLPVEAQITLIQDLKLSLANLVLARDRAPTEEELEAFTRTFLDLIRRVVTPALQPTDARARSKEDVP